MDEELKNKFRAAGFRDGEYEGMRVNIEGIIIDACEHPFKGIYLSSVHSTKRSVNSSEKFIPVDSSVQTIAKTVLEIYNELREPEAE